MIVNNSFIHDNTGPGVLVAPALTRAARANLRNNEFDDNGCGFAAARFGVNAANTGDCMTAAPNAVTGTSVINAFDNDIADSAFRAVFARGNSSTVRIGRNTITGTVASPALGVLDGGFLLSYGNNLVTGNPGGDGAPTGPLTPARVKRH